MNIERDEVDVDCSAGQPLKSSNAGKTIMHFCVEASCTFPTASSPQVHAVCRCLQSCVIYIYIYYHYISLYIIYIIISIQGVYIYMSFKKSLSRLSIHLAVAISCKTPSWAGYPCQDETVIFDSNTLSTSYSSCLVHQLFMRTAPREAQRRSTQLKADPLGEWYLVVVVVFDISFYEQGQSQHFDSKDSTWLSCSWIRSFMTSCSFRAETYPFWQTLDTKCCSACGESAHHDCL